MQSLKTSPALLTIIITRRFILYTKVAQSSLITHDPRLRKRCKLSDPLYRNAMREINWCHTWLGNTQELDFHSLHCVYRDRLLIFSHTVYWKKYLGATRIPCYNGVAV